MNYHPYFEVFGVIEMPPNGYEHDKLIREFHRMEPARESNSPIPVLRTDVPLTILTLPELASQRFTAEQWSALEAEFQPRFRRQPGQYCLKTNGDPSFLAFANPKGYLTGVERVHGFGHHSVDLINQAGDQLLDGCGSRVTERLCRFWKGSVSIVYFGTQPDRARFIREMEAYWLNYNRYLDGTACQLIATPFSRAKDCSHCSKAAS